MNKGVAKVKLRFVLGVLYFRWTPWTRAVGDRPREEVAYWRSEDATAGGAPHWGGPLLFHGAVHLRKSRNAHQHFVLETVSPQGAGVWPNACPGADAKARKPARKTITARSLVLCQRDLAPGGDRGMPRDHPSLPSGRGMVFRSAEPPQDGHPRPGWQGDMANFLFRPKSRTYPKLIPLGLVCSESKALMAHLKVRLPAEGANPLLPVAV